MASFFEKGRGNATKQINGKKVRGGYRYDFELYGQRYKAARGYDRKSDSVDAERELRRRLMLEHAGVIVAPASITSPRFANWAGVYMRWVKGQHALGNLKQPDAIRANVSSVLRFFGAKPTGDAYVHATAPYHDLTLADPITDPSWVRKFEDWMTDEGLAGQTRNHYVTTLSRMYWLALQSEYREASGSPPYNPFRDRQRQKWKRRTTTLTADQIKRWIQCASYHARLALSIAALNPKFRLENVLQTEWSDVDFEQRTITIWDHKTDDSGKALVSTIPQQLERILRDARERHPSATRVILYRGKPVKSIDEAVKNAAIAADLPWGRATPGGVTFHSIRHFASTQLARLGVPADRRKNVTGHQDLDMELWYTHLVPDDEREHTERLSESLDLEAAVMAGPRRISRPENARAAAAGVLRRAVGKSGAVGTAVGPDPPKVGDSVPKRPFPGLLRRPPSRAERLSKVLGKK